MITFIALLPVLSMVVVPMFAMELEWVDTVNPVNWLDKMRLQNVRHQAPSFIRGLN
jgi:hypothetical protein